MNLIISSYDKHIKKNIVNCNNDNIHDHFHKKLENNNPKIKYEKEPELVRYKMDKITYSKRNYDRYNMSINLYPKFKNESIKLNEIENYKSSKKYDGVVDGIIKNEIPSSYYQYKLKNKSSSAMLLNNLETSADIPNELNLSRLNKETGCTIPESKRDNIERQNTLNCVLDKYLNKTHNYTSETTDEIKAYDLNRKDKRINEIKNLLYHVSPASLNKNKIVIYPASNSVSFSGYRASNFVSFSGYSVRNNRT